MNVTKQEARLMASALYRAIDWTSASIDSLRGATGADDRLEMARERRVRRKYVRLLGVVQHRLAEKTGFPRDGRSA